MKTLNSISVSVSLALVAACATNNHTDNQPVVGGDDSTHDHGGDGSGGGSGSGSGGGTAAACPLGSSTFTTVLGADVHQRQMASLAIDLSGNVYVAGSVDSSFITNVFLGTAEIAASGQLGTVLPYGSLVATDAAGDLFVAGSFTSRIDFGNGLVLNPMGNIDVFVAKLDAKGHLLFAKALNLCGDGVSALAVAKDGRIAVSGSAMGTVVLDASGEIVFSVDAFGKVAFDAKGDLVIAGTVANATDMFVASYDVGGRQLFEQTFAATSSFVGAVVVDTSGNIAVVGYTAGTIDLFGTRIVAHAETEVGRTDGAFLLVVDSAGSLVLAKNLQMTEANGVAFDQNGNIFIAGADTSGMAFNRLVSVVEVDTRGQLTELTSISGTNGRALSLAIDACGSLYVALTLQPGGGISPIQLLVEKLSL